MCVMKCNGVYISIYTDEEDEILTLTVSSVRPLLTASAARASAAG